MLKSRRDIIILIVVLAILGFLIAMAIFPIGKETVKEKDKFSGLSNKEQYLKVLKGKEEDCNKIEDEYLRQQCHYTFTLNKAVEKKDISLCEKPKEKVELCKNNYYFQLAISQKDLELCQKIELKNLKQECINHIKNIETEQPSEQTTTEPKQKVCARIEEEQVKPVCQELNNLFSSIGQREPTKDECQTLKSKPAKEICFSVVRNKDKIDVTITGAYQEICSDVEDEKSQDICFRIFEELK